MSNLFGEKAGSVVTALVLLTLVGLIYLYLPAGTFAFALGLVAAVDSGFLVTLLIFVIQTPSFEVRVAKDEWDKQSPFYFLHVVVKNTSMGYLGGGIAADCQGSIIVDETSRPFTPKWATRAEPIQRDIVPKAGGGFDVIITVEPALIDQSKHETMGPEEERVLDIAVKVNGDPLCYIHEPENYYDPMHKRNPYGPGPHRISLTLKHGSRRAGPFEFVLDNGAGTKPDSLVLRPK